jgi:hypothetical protein
MHCNPDDTLVPHLVAEIEKLAAALRVIRDKEKACYRAADCRAVAREALSTSATGEES